MIGYSKYGFFLTIMTMMLSSCSGTKFLAPGEKLYTGSELKLESDEALTAKEKRSIKAEAEESFRPKPNKSFLGMRPRLWMYLVVGESPRGKFKKWLKRKGEEPVLISEVKPSATTEIIDAVLFNAGIFESTTQFRIKEARKTAGIIYTSNVHAPYVVGEVTFTIPDSNIYNIILNGKRKSLIKTGDSYNLDLLISERIRLDDLLKNNGYFYFSPDYFLFRADTIRTKQEVSLGLTLKDSIPGNALTQYKINTVTIDQEFSLSGTSNPDSARRGGMKIRQRALARAIQLRKNEIYSRKNHTTTLNRLMSMGNFKFVNIRFTESDTVAGGYLDAAIMMTPMPKHTFSTEIDIVSKSNNFTGPRMNLSYNDKNTFKGAEIFKFNLAGSYEAQLSGSNLYSYSWNPQVELNFPRFLVPFDIAANRNLIPRTRILFSYNYLKRVNYFTMRRSQFIYGFNWKENIREEHEFDPVSINYTSVKNRSEAFNDLLELNPYLKKSYEEQFIAGTSYTYTYNEQVIPDKKQQYFFQLTTELAGNVLSLARIIGGAEISAVNPSEVAGTVYSQYGKISAEGRLLYNLSDKNRLAFRLFAGVALPYGNSSSLPYTSQFFSGGPNSIRAFHINSVGPGSFMQETVRGFLQTGGEIKLELNSEYRFDIFRFLKGALFTDAGNIWLIKTNVDIPTDPFSIPGIGRELAIGAGFGLRFDFTFVILRFDLATPLRKPWLASDRRWVVNQVDFGSSAWRRENLVLNIAIGYPF